MTRSDRGQALLETLVSFPIIILTVTALFGGSYLIVTQRWIEHTSYELAVCALHTSTWSCKRTARERISNFLPFGRIQAIHVTSSKEHSQATVAFRILSRNIRSSQNVSM